jgi:hypothetical protein
MANFIIIHENTIFQYIYRGNNESKQLKGLFGSVVAVAFQIAFRAKMHADDFFLFFKNYF